MHRLFITALACLINVSVFGQFCGISGQITYISNQSELNLISGCTAFSGSIHISPTNGIINDINPLNTLEAIEGDLVFNISAAEIDNYDANIIFPNLLSIGGKFELSASNNPNIQKIIFVSSA